MQKPWKYINFTSKEIKNDSAKRTNTPTGLKLNRNHLPFMCWTVDVWGRSGYLSKPMRRGGEDVGEQMPPIWTYGFIFVQCFSMKLILHSYF